MNIIKERGICIEANPISNQVLEYYYDLRTHPLQTFFNNGIKVSISPDSYYFSFVKFFYKQWLLWKQMQ